MIVTYRREDLDNFFPDHPCASLYLRPSMCKYPAPAFQHVEVAGWSKPGKFRSGRLQRALIQVLHTLGVPLAVFKDYLNTELERILSITNDRAKAIQWLERDGAELSSGELTLTNTLHRMVMAGHDMQEPRVQELTARLVSASLNSLREKLSIPVAESTYAYGICDEFSFLQEDEVVVHTSRNGKGYIQGPVLVTRSPW
jgi:hypothetical protein